MPEDLVVQDGAVVREPDRRPVVLDQLEEAVPLGRELDEPVERVAEDDARSRRRPARSARTARPGGAAAPRNGAAAGTSRSMRPGGGRVLSRTASRCTGLRLVQHRCDVVAGRLGRLLDGQLAGEDLRRACCGGCSRSRRRPSASRSGRTSCRCGSALVDAVAEQVGRVRDVALRLRVPSRSSVLVKSLIQSAASALLRLVTGTARSEPPRKPGIGLPVTWPGITNCAGRRRCTSSRRSS